MRYTSYSEHLKNKYGEKVYKLPIHIETSCPNRDGNLSEGGCTFCGEVAAGFELLDSNMDIKQQLQSNREYIGKRYGASKFIAYLQNFTNTYMPLERFESIIDQIEGEDLVGISVSTRPDAIDDEILDYLETIAEIKGFDISIELGLQTVNPHTLKKINRGHSLAEFIDAVQRIKKRGFTVSTHMILNLPWDDREDVIEGAKILSALDVDYVKIHSLYILKNTLMGSQYQKGEINLVGVEEYVERVILFLRYLDPQIVIQRLLARAPEEQTLFCNWDMSWWRIRDMINDIMERDDVHQGDLCDYLGGKALRKFR
jgi:hypothetical protein